MSALNQHQREFVQQTLGRSMTPAEAAYLDENHGPDIGFIDLDPRPAQGRKQLVLYTACTGVQIRHYIARHRPEVYAQYTISHVMAHALSLRSAAPSFALPAIVPAVFRAADVLIYNPVDAAVAELSDREIVRQAKPGCKLASFGGPHHGCWWVICPFFGEEGVVAQLDQGQSGEQIWASFQARTFEPKFDERFKTQMAFLKGYQHGTDVRLTEFITDNYRRCKLFFTFNHPSCHLLAYVTDECLGQIGFERLGREHAINEVAADEMMMGDVFPETHYEWEHFKLEYPMRWAERQGGAEFYHGVILGIEERWRKARNA